MRVTFDDLDVDERDTAPEEREPLPERDDVLDTYDLLSDEREPDDLIPLPAA
jgi:hypothetical protein